MGSKKTKMSLVDGAKMRKNKNKSILDEQHSCSNSKSKFPAFLTQTEEQFENIFNVHQEKLDAQATFHAETMQFKL